jgi:hypothetical protein
MIRIMTAEESARTEITVDGQLSGECVKALETCCMQAIGKGKPVEVFLRDVSLIDPNGYVLLHRLAGKGVDLRAAGLYSSYLVDTIMAKRAEMKGRHHVTPALPRRDRQARCASQVFVA